MYFSRKFDSIEKVREYYRSLCIEQDIDSPHCYLNNDFNVNYGDVVLDIGAAEGNFSLDANGYVVFLYKRLKPPYLTRGVLKIQQK